MAEKMIRCPQMSVNEDFAELLEWNIEDGEKVSSGKILCSLETTKANFEVPCEFEGYIKIVQPVHAQVKVGDTLAYCFDSLEEFRGFDLAKHTNEATEKLAGAKATLKAVKKARELGISLGDIKVDRIITEKDVANFFDAKSQHGTSVGKAGNKSDAGRHGNLLVLQLPKIVIVGAGGHGAELLQIVREQRSFEVVGFIDREYKEKKEYCGLPVLGGDEILGDLRGQGVENVLIAAGWIKDASIRERIFDQCVHANLAFPSVVHKSAIVYPSAQISAGCQIFANAVIGSDAFLDFGVVVNNSSVVSHDCRIGRLTHIAPGAMLAGKVTVGSGCLIGMNTSIFIGVTVSDYSIINNNSSIYKDL
jgi:sugar O-acyltransferase (sialic acid O-acetyltransferase NeuD family)